MKRVSHPSRPEARAFRSRPLLLLLAAVLALWLITTFAVTVVSISGHSMEPTLYDGERALALKVEPWLHRLGLGHYRRGEIVYFRPPASAPGAEATVPLLGIRYRRLFVKRIIALGGETVRIADGRVYINGRRLSERYLPYLGSASMPPVRVPQGDVFVLGDNRAPLASEDSRLFGPIPASSIVGQVAVILWPPARWGVLKRPAAYRPDTQTEKQRKDQRDKVKEPLLSNFGRVKALAFRRQL